MSVIRNKLRAKDGVSIFMGLMFLLVALMVGAVVLTASTASAGKLIEMKENEQDYLTVASAARMVRDRICELKYTYKTTDGMLDGDGETLIASDNKEVILKNELTGLCRVLARKQQGLDQTDNLIEKTFEITGGEGWDTVKGSLSMDENGKIIVGLWLEDGEENKRNHMQIEFLADGPVTNRYETYEVICVGEVKDEETGKPIPIYETITHVHKTTTCSWPESGCTISKGQ